MGGTQMVREILVYGHGDKSEDGFETEETLKHYLEGGIFDDEDGRYRYSQTKTADVIVLARDGLAFGHFEIDDAVPPTKVDREAYPPVRKVYLVRKSVRYEKPVRLSNLDISRYQFGRHIDERQFEEILKGAGDKHEVSR
jgi:hypothetical protein